MFINGKADWITIFEAGDVPFNPSALKAFNLPQEEPAFQNTITIRWENIGRFREVGLYSLPNGDLNYVLAIVASPRC